MCIILSTAYSLSLTISARKRLSVSCTGLHSEIQKFDSQDTHLSLDDLKEI